VPWLFTGIVRDHHTPHPAGPTWRTFDHIAGIGSERHTKRREFQGKIHDSSLLLTKCTKENRDRVHLSGPNAIDFYYGAAVTSRGEREQSE